MTRRWLRGVATAALLLGAAPAALAATLNAETTIIGDQVTLGDIFSGLDPALAATFIAAAPDPGSAVRLDLDWIGRVARAYGIDWAPMPGDTGVTIGRASAAEQAAMAAALSADLSQAIAAAQQPVVNPQAEAAAALASAQSAAEELVVVPVLLRRVRSGEMIQATDIGFQNIAPSDLPSGVVLDAASMVGMTARRLIAPQQPVAAQDIRTPTVVSRGTTVTMMLTSGALQLTARGRAIDDGSLGDTIRVINTDSNRTVQVLVAGPNLVMVPLDGAAR